jgi:Dolichyl-phosphate-mannose-protein mannosyltransferase
MDLNRTLKTADTGLSIETKVVLLALLVGLFNKLCFGWHAPFWLDEAYSGTIATQTSFSGLWKWLTHELSGPVYYGFLFLWEKIAGDSNFALRLPSLFFSVAAIIVLVTTRTLSQRERLLWAALAAVWLPNIAYSAIARPQALLFFLACLQATIFLKCTKQLTTRRLSGLSAVSALLLGTHLHSALSTGVLMLFLLMEHRAALFKYWKGFLPLVPIMLWLPIQLSFVASFMKPGVAAYNVLPPIYPLLIPFDLFGLNWSSVVVALLLIAILATQYISWRTKGIAPPYTRGEVALVLAGLVPFLLIVGIGMIKSSYSSRYIIPFAPGILLGATMILARTRILLGILPSAVLGAWAAACLTFGVKTFGPSGQVGLNAYEFERSAAWLIQHGERRITLVWNSPSAQLNDPALQNEMAGYFFRRADYGADTTATGLAGPDKAKQLWEIAHQNNSAIMLIDDWRGWKQTRSVPGLTCQRFGERPYDRAMACRAPVR